MHMVAATPGVRSVNEPDLPELVARRGLPTGLEGTLEPHFRKIVDVPAGADERFRAHFFDGYVTRVRGPYDLFSPSFHVLTDRRVLKIVHATAIAEWIVEQGLCPVYLIRHPVATALSATRSSIIHRAEANLRHEGFRRRFLNDDLIELGWSILRSGSPLEKFVLEWCLDNLGPLHAMRKDPARWTVVSYEEMMTSPTRLSALLGRRLELRRPERMLKVLRTPSPSTTRGRDAKLRHTEPVALLGLWQREVDAKTQATLFEIVERFHIDAYRPGETMPTDRYLHNLEDTVG
jgi:hypothetical protein